MPDALDSSRTPGDSIRFHSGEVPPIGLSRESTPQTRPNIMVLKLAEIG